MTEFIDCSSSRSMSDSCEGPLKQQCLGDSGLYRWEDRHFRLHIQSGILEVYTKNDETKEYETEATLMSFVGAKHAKEWSISTPTIGSYGYDVVWDSGRIWSFLATDMATCRRWVQSINSSISHNPVESSHDIRKESMMHTRSSGLRDQTTYPSKQSQSATLNSASTITVVAARKDVANTNIMRDMDATCLETHTPGHGIGTDPAQETAYFYR
jgi:hypothetical protein